MPSRKLRRDKRIPVEAPIRLSWQDPQGAERVAKGNCVDISDKGLGVLMDESISLRTYVCFRLEAIRFAGSGSVRYVSRKGLRYLVGIEFSGTLRWQGGAPTATARV